MPALKFINLGSGRVNVGSAPPLDDILTGTIIAVCTPTAVDLNGGRIYQKSYLGADGSYWVLAINDGGTGLLHFGYSRSVTDLTATATCVTLNQRQFFASTFNGAGGNTDQKLYRGTDQSPVTEVAAYSAQTTGSGTHPTDAGANGYIGNRGNFNVGFPGTIELLAIYRDRILTPSELRDAQVGLLPRAGLVGYWLPGAAGPNFVPDLSGNGNHGVPFGTTLSPDGPTGLYLPRRKLYLDIGGAIAKSGFDSIDFATLESLPVLNSFLTRLDTLETQANEARTLASSSQRTDSLDVAAVETTPPTLLSTSRRSDSLNLAVADAGGVFFSLLANDTLGLSIVEGTPTVQVGTSALTVELVEGTTVRASRSIAPTASWQEFSFELTANERASITSPNDLRLRFTSSSAPVLVSSVRPVFSTAAGAGGPQLVTKTASDSLAWGLQEAAAIAATQVQAAGVRSLLAFWLGGAGLLQRAGYRSLLGYWLGGAGLTSTVVAKTALDTLGFTVVEGVPVTSVFLLRADILGMQATAATSTLFSTTQTSDALSLALTESTPVILVTLGRSDMLSLTVGELTSLLSKLQRTDTLGIQAAEVTALLSKLQRSDTLNLAAGESAVVLMLGGALFNALFFAGD
jgi:hypothetical protein